MITTRTNLFITLIFIFSIFIPFLPVSGQVDTFLSVNPVTSDFIQGYTKTITLDITDGVDVNAFDVTITYDANVLNLTSWSHGNFLSNLANVVVTNNPGLLRVVATQLATPPVTGSGVLLNLVFRGTTNGISPIVISNAVFSGINGKSYPALQHGSLIVHSDPAGVPTRTVTGSLRLQGQSSFANAVVNLGFGQTHWLGPYAALTTADLPNLSLPGVADDTYQVTIELPRYLGIPAELGKTFSVSASSASLPPLTLLSGNAVWQRWVDGAWLPDTVIDAADAGLVGAQYLQTGAELDGDVNFSGRVDIFDLAIVSGNYGLTSEAAYADWPP